jgi:TRAP-type C4-dicarboxylate transport system permease small subunit
VPGAPATIVGVLLCFGACASLVYLAYTRAHQKWRRNKLPPLDWIWFVGLPFLSYLVLLLAGGGFLIEASLAMYAAAAGLTLLVVTGIRNAWDLVLWTAKQHKE